MSYSHHGGGCCGVFHVHDLPTSFNSRLDKDDAKSWLKRSVEAGRKQQYERFYEGPDSDCDCDDCSGSTVGQEDAVYAVDIVLADYQMDCWEDVLIAAGFKMVLTFTNTNSGNDCYIFVGVTSELKL